MHPVQQCAFLPPPALLQRIGAHDHSKFSILRRGKPRSVASIHFMKSDARGLEGIINGVDSNGGSAAGKQKTVATAEAFSSASELLRARLSQVQGEVR